MVASMKMSVFWVAEKWSCSAIISPDDGGSKYL
jgi:hypothetical protein